MPALPSDRTPQLAYSSGQGAGPHGNTIRLMDLTSGRSRLVARPPATFGPPRRAAETGFYLPAWSPDGHWLAFAGRRRHAGRVVTSAYVVREDGTGLRQVAGTRYTSSQSRDLSPQWTADGRSILVPLGHRWRIARVLSGGRSVRNAANVQYSPTGRRAVFASDQGLFELRPPHRTLRQISTDGSSPAWSPDGRQLVFLSSRDKHGDLNIGESHVDGGANEIYITDLTRSRRVTTTTSDETTPQWSPDGRIVLYSEDEGAYDQSRRGGVLHAITPNGMCRRRLPTPTGRDLITTDGFALRPGSDTRRLAPPCHPRR